MNLMDDTVQGHSRGQDQNPAMTRYLARIHRGLLCVDSDRRREIMDELADSLFERAREQGGEGADFQTTAVALADPPEMVVRRYRDIYGYGTFWTLGAIGVIILVALFTRPQMVDEDRPGRTAMLVIMSLTYLVLLPHYSLAGGWKVGLGCGLAGAFLRTLALLGFLGSGSVEDVSTGLFATAYLMLTVAGLALGTLPGMMKSGYLRRYHWLD